MIQVNWSRSNLHNVCPCLPAMCGGCEPYIINQCVYDSKRPHLFLTLVFVTSFEDDHVPVDGGRSQVRWLDVRPQVVDKDVVC